MIRRLKILVASSILLLGCNTFADWILIPATGTNDLTASTLWRFVGSKRAILETSNVYDQGNSRIRESVFSFAAEQTPPLVIPIQNEKYSLTFGDVVMCKEFFHLEGKFEKSECHILERK